MPAMMGTMTVVSPNTQEAKGVREPKGTGPYLFNTWTPGQSVTLKRFDGYWGDKPEVENATYVWRNESAVRAAMVKTGEADIAASIGVQDANDPKMDFSYFNSETSRLRIDMTRAPLNDIRVRKAMNLAIDLDGLTGTIFPEGVVKMTQIVVPSINGHNPTLKPWPYNPAEAKKLVKAAKADGVPVDNSNFASNSQQSGFGGGAYDYGNMAGDIDPSTVKTMSVLKGAAATALYGSRGANGVILITTKDGSGAKRGIGVSINSSVTFDQVDNLIPLQQMYGGGSTNSNYPHGFSELIQDGITYLYPNYKKDGAWGPKYDPNVLVRHWDSWDPTAANYKETRPWIAPENGFEEFFETGVTVNNTIAFEGANDKGSFRLGYTNLDQTGTLPQSNLQRNSLSLNSNYNLTDKLKAGISMNYVNTTADGRNATGYNNNNPMQAFNQWWQTQLDIERLENNQDNGLGQQYTWNPVGPIVDPDTKQLVEWNANPNYFDNPYWVRNNYLQEDVRNRLFGNANLSYQLTEDLSIATQFSTDWYQFSIREGTPLRSVDLSSYSETERKFQETNMDVRLNYIKDINDDVSITAFVGANRMKSLSSRTSISTNGGIVVDKFFNIANSGDNPSATTYQQDRGINSVYGSVSLGFKELIYFCLLYTSPSPRD